jgi:hypothetical protein
MKLKINPYDLVICDEFCSLLSHFDYNKLQEPEVIHKIFEAIIKNSTQTFFLDGDISNREILYLQKYFDYKNKPLFNINTGDKYNIYVNYDADKYYENITNDLKNNKKICVVSMSSNFALDVYNKYVDNYKCIVIYGNSDDKIKSKLENVEDLFIKYDLVIYSPTITVGVDFNKPYFDKIYGYMCLGSVCPRVFFQMLFRVRQTTDKNIIIHSNKANQIFLNSENGKIYLGKNQGEGGADALVQKMVLGGELVKIMSELIDLIVKQKFATSYGPTYDIPYGPLNAVAFLAIKGRLNTLLSATNFLSK